MVIDKGLGVAETEDWLQLCGDFVDVVKLGFGTALLYPPAVLRQKLALLRAARIDVLPGGTLLELAYRTGAVEAFFHFVQAHGFSSVEVSDGTIELPVQARHRLIEQAKDRGFVVLSEVGKKDPTRPVEPDFVLRQIAADMAAGADRVIVEGRDSGRGVGIYDDRGGVRHQLFKTLAAGLSRPEAVIWEAPQPVQQRVLLQQLGPHVNFGNVQPEDVVTLEAMRRGLRSDTMGLRWRDPAGVWSGR